MGNSEATLKKNNLVCGNSKIEVHDDWNVSEGKLNGTTVNIFSAIHPPSSKKRNYMEKALQASKIYRHPGILRFMDGGIIDKEVIIVTEAASPLLLYGLDRMSTLQITAGLASIIEALVFLHDKAGVSHNNVCASSIYITSDGSWKLWGMEYLCSFGDLNRDHIERINQYCSERNLPPDDKSRITPAYQHSRDCYFLAKFIDNVIAPHTTLDAPFFEDFLLFIKTKGMHSDWSKRPRLSVFLSQPIFDHEFIKLRYNITNILLLSVQEREEFIRSLPEKLRKYSDDVVAVTFGPLLLRHSFFLVTSAAQVLMPCLLMPKCDTNEGLFSVSVFKETIIPLILNLFEARDCSVRKALLEYFKYYCELIPKVVLAKDILPELLLGIRDTDDNLVTSTLHCLAYLVPILGANTVIGKNREHIFSTSKPKINVSKLQNIEKRKKEKKLLNLKPSSTVHVDEVNEELAVIPERSSPDGGEVSDEDVFTYKVNESKNDNTNWSDKKEKPDDWSDKKEKVFDCLDKNALNWSDKRENVDDWSDWEEMLDQPPPKDIFGILQVRTSLDDESRSSSYGDDYNNSTGWQDKWIDKGINDSIQGVSNVSKNSKQNVTYASNDSADLPLSTKDSSIKGVSKQNIKSKLQKTSSHSLGEEYDIMSIKVEKKPDSELDLFADLIPSLNTNNYDLERMLMEASHKAEIKKKLPSLSDTLAEINTTDEVIEEGDGWNDDWDKNEFEDPFVSDIDSSLILDTKRISKNSDNFLTSSPTHQIKHTEDSDSLIVSATISDEQITSSKTISTEDLESAKSTDIKTISTEDLELAKSTDIKTISTEDLELAKSTENLKYSDS